RDLLDSLGRLGHGPPHGFRERTPDCSKIRNRASLRGYVPFGRLDEIGRDGMPVVGSTVRTGMTHLKASIAGALLTALAVTGAAVAQDAATPPTPTQTAEPKAAAVPAAPATESKAIPAKVPATAVTT